MRSARLPAPELLLHVLMLPDFDRADRIESSGATQSRALAELLIDCGTLRAVLVGILGDVDR